jgi:Flp pilus assembly protein TadG
MKRRLSLKQWRPLKQGRHRKRRATAIVEFAVVLPLLLTLLMGIIEYGWIFMVRQTLTNAAREGCRIAVLNTATEDAVATRIREVMEPLGFAEGTQWSFTASPIDEETQEIAVSVQMDQISITGGYILSGDGGTMSGRCTMRKEGVIDVDDDEG